MKTERTIHILDRDVRLRYCAATESGFEQLRKKSIYQIDFHSNEDLIALSLAAIIAAYARSEEEAPINSDDLLYDAAPQDIITLMTATVELRNEWYNVPKVVEDTIKAEQTDTVPSGSSAGESTDEEKN
jgi:hypothetical protein